MPLPSEANDRTGSELDLGIENDCLRSEAVHLFENVAVPRRVIKSQIQDKIELSRFKFRKGAHDVAAQERIPLLGNVIVRECRPCGIDKLGAAFDADDMVGASIERSHAPSPISARDVQYSRVSKDRGIAPDDRFPPPR